jgi:hypothetical protein
MDIETTYILTLAGLVALAIGLFIWMTLEVSR